MTKSKGAQHIVLKKNQLETLIWNSIGNIENVTIQSDEKIHNRFLVTLILGIIIEEAFPRYKEKGMEVGDYEPMDFYVSHMVEPLQPFGVELFRLNNKETDEKLWGIHLDVYPKNIGDFVEALAEVSSFWEDIGETEETSIEPSKDSVVVKGNDTVN